MTGETAGLGTAADVSADTKETKGTSSDRQPKDKAKPEQRRLEDYRENAERAWMDGELRTPRHRWKISHRMNAGEEGDVMEAYLAKPISRPKQIGVGGSTTGTEKAEEWLGAGPRVPKPAVREPCRRSYALKMARRRKRTAANSAALVRETAVLASVWSGGRFRHWRAEQLKPLRQRQAFFPKLYDFGSVDETHGYEGFEINRRLEELNRLMGEGGQKYEKKAAFRFPEPVPFLVMERLRLNLEELEAGAPLRRLTGRVAFPLALACAEALAALHSFGFLHRNVQPRNFLLRAPLGFRRPPAGLEWTREAPVPLQVVLCDFGTSMVWPSRPQNPAAYFQGSLLFASPDSHLGRRPSPMDDFFSLHYVLLGWLISPRELPWAASRVNQGTGGVGPVKQRLPLAELYAPAEEAAANATVSFAEEMTEAHRQLVRASEPPAHPSAGLPNPKDPNRHRSVTQYYQEALDKVSGGPSPPWLPFDLHPDTFLRDLSTRTQPTQS